MIIETPDWDLECVGLAEVSGSNYEEFGKSVSTIYEPAEDTFLMLDALEMDLERVLRGRLLSQRAAASATTKCESLVVIELGCGLGLLSAAIAKALRDCDASASVGVHCVAVDVNPAACSATTQTCRINGVQVDVVRGDLLTWMRWPESTAANDDNPQRDVYGPIDLLLFNPPYVRSPDGESAPAPVTLKVDTNDQKAKSKLLSMMADAAWLGGGPYGVDVLKRALHQAADLLSERGVFYALMIDYNYSALVYEEMRARRLRARNEENARLPAYQDDSKDYIVFTTFGSGPTSKPLACRRLLSRHVPEERLAVYRIYRPHFLSRKSNRNLADGQPS